MAPSFFSRRDGGSSSNVSSATYIAGFAVAGVIVLALIIWLSVKFARKRAQDKRESDRGAAFLTVRGIVKEGEVEKEPSSEAPRLNGTGFSRTQMDNTTVLPHKTIARPSPAATKDEVIQYHRESGMFPRPFAFALNASSSSSRSSTLGPGPASHSHTKSRSTVFSSFTRDSFMSTASNNRFSVVSTMTNSSTPSTGGGQARKVHQIFTPVLPDELLLTKLGERLTIVQSFDDGWCVVGRESSIFAQPVKSLFKPDSEAAAGPNVELGVVPAWCFLKPVPGLRAERPVRSSSLGITVHMEGPGFSSRDDVMSWSNF